MYSLDMICVFKMFTLAAVWNLDLRMTEVKSTILKASILDKK